MHINDVLAAADYRMVMGRDWIWDFLGKDCREIVFESYGLHDPSEHYPVDAVFCCGDGSVRQLTVAFDGSRALRWLNPECESGYILACSDAGVEPWQEPDIEWIEDPQHILDRVRLALHPDRRPSDSDESYRWTETPMEVWHEDDSGDVTINPS